MKRIMSWILAFTLAVSLAAPASAADKAEGSTLRLAEYEGTVKVVDAAGKEKTARKDMRLYNGYVVETGKSSSAYITLDGEKAIKLDKSSKVELKKAGKKIEVSLDKGQLFFNVDKALAADESLNLRTATTVTGVRGSFGWKNLNETGLMHGKVIEVSNETGRTTMLTSGQRTGADGAAQPIRNENVPAIVIGEMLKKPLLVEQVKQDVKSVDTAALLAGYADRLAAEQAAENAADAAAAAALAEQLKRLGDLGDKDSPWIKPAGPKPTEPTPPNPIERTYTVTFYANRDGNDTDHAARSMATGDALPSAKSLGFKHDGYEFVGWYLNRQGDGTRYDAMTFVKEVKFYAAWEPTGGPQPTMHTITFNANGGVGTMAAQRVEDGVRTRLNKCAFTRDGYDFNGWKDAAGSDYADEAEVELHGDLALTAQWSAKQPQPTDVTVTFHANFGNDETKTQTVTAGEETALDRNTFTRDGYSFSNWNTRADGQGNPFADGSSVTFDEDKDLYAQWNAVGYEVVFELDGGTLSAGNAAAVNNPMAYTIESTDVLPDATKAAASFDGWKVTTADGSWTLNDTVAAGTSLTGKYGNVTLTAQWKGEQSFESGDTTVTIDFTSGKATVTRRENTTGGGMRDYTGADEVDWKDYRASITELVVDGETNGGVTQIGRYAFAGCANLAAPTLPDSVTSIGEFAFADCTSITTFTVPKNLTSFGAGAFRGCAALRRVTVADGNERFEVGPESSGRDLALYEMNTSGQLSYAETLVLHPAAGGVEGGGFTVNAEKVAAYAFSGVTMLKGIGFGSGLSEIGEYAFENCAALENVRLDTVVNNEFETISAGAFSGCSSLASMTLNTTVKNVGENAFDGCDALASVSYSGTTADWDNVVIADGNEPLKNAMVICDGVPYGCVEVKFVWVGQQSSVDGPYCEESTDCTIRDGKLFVKPGKTARFGFAPGVVMTVGENQTQVSCTFGPDLASVEGEQLKLLKTEKWQSNALNYTDWFEVTAGNTDVEVAMNPSFYAAATTKDEFTTAAVEASGEDVAVFAPGGGSLSFDGYSGTAITVEASNLYVKGGTSLSFTSSNFATCYGGDTGAILNFGSQNAQAGHIRIDEGSAMTFHGYACFDNCTIENYGTFTSNDRVDFGENCSFTNSGKLLAAGSVATVKSVSINAESAIVNTAEGTIEIGSTDTSDLRWGAALLAQGSIESSGTIVNKGRFISTDASAPSGTQGEGRYYRLVTRINDMAATFNQNWEVTANPFDDYPYVAYVRSVDDMLSKDVVVPAGCELLIPTGIFQMAGSSSSGENGSLESSGTITVLLGAEIHDDAYAGFGTGEGGTLDIYGKVEAISNSGFAGSAIVEFGGTLILGPVADNSADNDGTITVKNGGTLTVDTNSGVINRGTVTIDAGGKFELISGGVGGVFENMGAVNVSGTMTIGNGFRFYHFGMHDSIVGVNENMIEGDTTRVSDEGATLTVASGGTVTAEGTGKIYCIDWLD